MLSKYVAILCLFTLVLGAPVKSVIKNNAHTLKRLPSGGLAEEIDNSLNITEIDTVGSDNVVEKGVVVENQVIEDLIQNDEALNGGTPVKAEPIETSEQITIEEDTKIVHGDNTGEVRFNRSTSNI